MGFFTSHFEVIEGLASTVTCWKVSTHTEQTAPFFSLIAGLFLKQGRLSTPDGASEHPIPGTGD